MKTVDDRNDDPSSSEVNGPPQGEGVGPLTRYRAASPFVCRLASVLGWMAILAGAAQVAIGIVVFHDWRKEGGWWAGIASFLLGLVATGITADTPVDTPLFSRLVSLGLTCLMVDVVTLLVLDGARWLDTKDLRYCVNSFDDVCSGIGCTCTEPDLAWDKCMDFDNCTDLPGTTPTLLASSVVLLLLTLDSGFIFILGLRCRFCRGQGAVAGVAVAVTHKGGRSSSGRRISACRDTVDSSARINRRVFPSDGIGSRGLRYVEEDGNGTTAPTGGGAMVSSSVQQQQRQEGAAPAPVGMLKPNKRVFPNDGIGSKGTSFVEHHYQTPCTEQYGMLSPPSEPKGGGGAGGSSAGEK